MTSATVASHAPARERTRKSAIPSMSVPDRVTMAR